MLASIDPNNNSEYIMTKYRKNNITLQLRIPIKTAVTILGRLYGCGVLNRSQYYHKLSQIDKAAAELERKKDEKIEKLLKKVFTTKK